jgi:L-alanine-DL-glutamate epimerase-like enolase superfamily enzyme
LKIKDLKVNMLRRQDPKSIYPSSGILRIITEEGIEGWSNDVTEDMARLLQGSLREVLVGRDAMEREKLWHEMLHWERFRWLPRGLRGSIDIALWDIAGKKLGQPVWRLLGACRDRVPAYKTQSGTFGAEGQRVDHFVQFALQAKAEGYLGSKDHCYAGAKFMIDLARELRAAVGPGFRLMHDAVQHYDVADAIRVGRVLEKFEFSWLEEPLRDQDYIGLKKVCDALDVQVVAGEYFPAQLHGYCQMLALGAADGIKPGPQESGGITEMMKLAHLAEAFGAAVHVSTGSNMWGFTAAHVNGGIMNSPIMEVHPPFEKGTHRAVKNPLKVENGYVTMPEKPGLGIDLDWSVIEADTEIVI